MQLQFDQWPDLLPLIQLIQSTVNNSSSPQRGNVAPFTTFHRADPTPPIATFLRTDISPVITLDDLQRERWMNIYAIIDSMDNVRSEFQMNLEEYRETKRNSVSRGTLPTFEIVDYVLLARSDFHTGEKLALGWRGLRRVVGTVSDSIYAVEDLRNAGKEDVPIKRLKFSSNQDLDEEAVMTHVLSSETGLPVHHLMQLQKDPDGLKVIVLWKGLPDSED